MQYYYATILRQKKKKAAFLRKYQKLWIWYTGCFLFSLVHFFAIWECSRRNYKAANTLDESFVSYQTIGKLFCEISICTSLFGDAWKGGEVSWHKINIYAGNGRQSDFENCQSGRNLPYIKLIQSYRNILQNLVALRLLL